MVEVVCANGLGKIIAPIANCKEPPSHASFELPHTRDAASTLHKYRIGLAGYNSAGTRSLRSAVPRHNKKASLYMRSACLSQQRRQQKGCCNDDPFSKVTQRHVVNSRPSL